jgi:IPT/TIG domain-containing protein
MFRSKSVPARLGRVGLAAAVAAAGSLVWFQGVSNAAPATYTASPLTGPSANATYVITLAGTGFADAAGNSLVQSAATGVKFATTCGANVAGTTGTNATRFNVISATRLAVTTPSLTLVGSSTAFKVCVFDTSTNLLGSGTYTIYAAPALTAALKPGSGPAFGGNTIAITGTGFTTKSTVKVDGVAASNVKVTGTTNITATVPAHAAGTTAVNVVVTTEGGPNPTPGTASFYQYTYQSAIAVTPAFGPAATVVDLKGVGFSALDWTAAKVFFSLGAYNPAQVGTTGVKTNPEVGTCGSVQVISDTELVCAVPSITSAAYTVTVVSSGVLDADTTVTGYTQSVVSSGATYTVSPY